MKILLPVDGSPLSDVAVAFVAHRPAPGGERLEIDLLNVQPPIPPRAGRAVDADIARAWHEAEAGKVLRPAVDVLQAAQLEPAWFHRVGYPGVVIAEWAEEHASDLIVMGSHGRTAAKNLIFGSVTQTVLSYTSVPLLVLRAPRLPTRASLRVGIAVDGSDCSLAAARFVVEHLGFFGPRARFALLHVVDRAEPSEPAPAGRRAAPAIEASKAEALACERVVAPAHQLFVAAGQEVERVCATGHPGIEIADWARKAGLDLLVMGSHGRGSLTSALVGSVAWRALAGCQTPVLLVRAPR